MTRLSRFIHVGILLGIALLLMAPVTESSRQTGTSSLYMTVKGQKQGDIKGSVTQKGREGWISMDAWSHEVVSPTDAASGLPTGRRQHKPLTITKTIDRATPLLFNALTQNENLTTVELKFYRPSAKTGTGIEELYFTVKLENASISGISHRTNETSGRELENVSFTYQKITWTWIDGGITAEDDWESPVV